MKKLSDISEREIRYEISLDELHDMIRSRSNGEVLIGDRFRIIPDRDSDEDFVGLTVIVTRRHDMVK